MMEVLAALIRDHSSEQWPPAEPGAETPERATRPDVQAAVTVIGRRNPRHDRAMQKVDPGEIPVPRLEPGISRLTLVGDRASSTDPEN